MREVEVETVQADMRNFCRSESFDLALNLFSSLGYFEDPDDNVRALACFHDSLKPGGKLVVDTMAKEVLARDWQPQRWQGLDTLEPRLLLSGDGLAAAAEPISQVDDHTPAIEADVHPHKHAHTHDHKHADSNRGPHIDVFAMAEREVKAKKDVITTQVSAALEAANGN